MTEIIQKKLPVKDNNALAAHVHKKYFAIAGMSANILD